MARVTVEDSLEHVENRFALVHAATQRAKQLYQGARPLVECTNREIVISLREIADGKINIEETADGAKKTEKKKTAKKKKVK